LAFVRLQVAMDWTAIISISVLEPKPRRPPAGGSANPKIALGRMPESGAGFDPEKGASHVM
jgi:hypothetical protein